MTSINLKKKISFNFIILILVVLVIEVFSFAAFFIIEKQWFSFSSIYSERNSRAHETNILESASVEKTYKFLDNLGSAEIIAKKGNHVTTASFTMNDDTREVLFEHPNSEVIFKDVPINEKAELKFGIGLDERAWDKTGDGVLFEIITIDEKFQKTLLFLKYIDPKNNVEDRKWFDERIDLSVFAGQRVSFVFKTTGGPEGNKDADWAGWSSPEVTYGNFYQYQANTNAYQANTVIHPYLGYVFKPESNKSDYGFRNVTKPIQTKSNNKVILGIFGGSVAFDFSYHGIDSLINELKKSPKFFNKEIVVVRVAVIGYKQPQQLMALNYLLALGAYFDIIINVDGFNEITIPPAENIPKDVFPFFPIDWLRRVQDLPDPNIQSLVGEITYLRLKRSRWAVVFSKVPFRYSITMNFIWKYYDRNLAMAISRNELTLQNYKPEVRSTYASTGPNYRYESESYLFRDLASVWKMSSIQMHKLCSANGIRYFHFLQPNQYVPGSKKMGEKELRQALLENHPYKNWVERGYPYLIKAGKDLVNQGVNFHDLTMIFADKIEPIYSDNIGHYNKTGNDILGIVIGKAIIQYINTENTWREK